MEKRPRVLFVDDEPNIRMTLSAILEKEGFQTTAASTVAEALALISAERYDALIADLNIGQPGDGFTVVSAMRRTQPEAVTMILTGYPAFEAALRAIREQVDDFHTKPTNIDQLVSALRLKLSGRRYGAAITVKRLPQLLAENVLGIIEAWYQAIEQIPEMTAIPLSREDRLDHLPDVLREMTRGRSTDEDEVGDEALKAAAHHGARRRRQGYSVPMVLEEARILQQVISDFTRQHLLHVEISLLIPDLTVISDRLHRLFQESVRAYLDPDAQPSAA